MCWSWLAAAHESQLSCFQKLWELTVKHYKQIHNTNLQLNYTKTNTTILKICHFLNFGYILFLSMVLRLFTCSASVWWKFYITVCYCALPPAPNSPFSDDTLVARSWPSCSLCAMEASRRWKLLPKLGKFQLKEYS